MDDGIKSDVSPLHGVKVHGKVEGRHLDRDPLDPDAAAGPNEDSAEMRAVKNQADDLRILAEAIEILRTKMRNKLTPEIHGDSGDCGHDQPATVLEHMKDNNHRINRLTAAVLDMTRRYQA